MPTTSEFSETYPCNPSGPADSRPDRHEFGPLPVEPLRREGQLSHNGSTQTSLSAASTTAPAVISRRSSQNRAIFVDSQSEDLEIIEVEWLESSAATQGPVQSDTTIQGPSAQSNETSNKRPRRERDLGWRSFEKTTLKASHSAAEAFQPGPASVNFHEIDFPFLRDPPQVGDVYPSPLSLYRHTVARTARYWGCTISRKLDSHAEKVFLRCDGLAKQNKCSFLIAGQRLDTASSSTVVLPESCHFHSHGKHPDLAENYRWRPFLRVPEAAAAVSELDRNGRLADEDTIERAPRKRLAILRGPFATKANDPNSLPVATATTTNKNDQPITRWRSAPSSHRSKEAQTLTAQSCRTKVSKSVVEDMCLRTPGTKRTREPSQTAEEEDEDEDEDEDKEVHRQPSDDDTSPEAAPALSASSRSPIELTATPRGAARASGASPTPTLTKGHRPHSPPPVPLQPGSEADSDDIIIVSQHPSSPLYPAARIAPAGPPPAASFWSPLRSCHARAPPASPVKLPSPPLEVASFLSALTSHASGTTELVASLLVVAGFDTFRALAEFVAFEPASRHKVWNDARSHFESAARSEDKRNAVTDAIEEIERALVVAREQGWS